VRGLLDGPSPPHRDAEDKLGWTAFVIAAREGNRDVVELLLDHPADTSVQSQAADGGDAAAVRGPLDGPSPPHIDVRALTEASWNGHWAVVELLLDRGADVHAADKHGFTALRSAAWKGHRDVVELLLDRGADINTQYEYGFTALIKAALEGHQDVVQLLPDRGADTQPKDNFGQTAQHLAKTVEIRLLLERVSEVALGGGLGLSGGAAIVWMKWPRSDVLASLGWAGGGAELSTRRDLTSSRAA
jgi:ankyrin repeat protein